MYTTTTVSIRRIQCNNNFNGQHVTKYKRSFSSVNLIYQNHFCVAIDLYPTCWRYSKRENYDNPKGVGCGYGSWNEGLFDGFKRLNGKYFCLRP